ncbi:tryptophan aminotransferase-related protein 4-like [Argentina anserina]|uniref:tryptophan aminotransferase-related protein 4-like n=1 Tax=Argentina anserina TaxID=57926 RepID=UPI0021764465|nr:tryptophan aminotransferase-related protein 4-like [Potentilla anserina]
MAKLQPNSSVVCLLVFSVVVNLSFIFKLYGHGGQWELSWSRRAAEEAEQVAAVPCSGHGRAYLDGLVLDGNQPACECNSCFGGSDCSQFLTDCESNADGGDPFFLEPFWMEHASKSAILVAGWHRMGYTFSDKAYISQELERLIRKVHDIAGNAVTQGRYIVVGAGSTHLLNAAVQALSSSSNDSSDSLSSSPASIVVTIPYYALYETQTEYFQSVNYKFEGDGSLLKNISDGSKRVIEFVTAPNNPDGKLNNANFEGPNSAAIYDRVYYWPHFTPIPTPANDDVMVFSISKLTGHAGTRLGWAVIKDEAVYQRMLHHTLISNLGISRDAQLRAMKLLNVVVEGGGKEIFKFGYTTMRKRWERLRNTLSLSNRFSVQRDEPLYCKFFQKIKRPSPAYAWVKCERLEDVDCYQVLQEEANVYGRRGSVFGAEDRYVRLALIRSQDDFDILLHRLNQLVSKEDTQHRSYMINVTTDRFFRGKTHVSSS